MSEEATEYRPSIIHYDGEGDAYWEFILEDVPALVEVPRAAEVEIVRRLDGDREVIGVRVYDAPPSVTDAEVEAALLAIPRETRAMIRAGEMAGALAAAARVRAGGAR